MPRLSEICLYENFVCFLQNLSSSCQSNHIIFNYCQDLARSYKFKEDLGKILNFEKATVHWFTGWWLNCSHIQPPKTFLFFSFAPVRILYVPPHSYVFVSVFWLAACGKSMGDTFSHTGNSNFIVPVIFILDYRLGKPAFSSDTLPI